MIDPAIEVHLEASMGDDLAIVNAARVSLAKRSDWGQSHWASNGLDLTFELKDADKGLINYLMANRHGTPFEMVQFRFRVRVPIFVAREWQRHRIGSFNEVSSRYVEMVPEAYSPPVEDFRTQVGKPGHYTYEPLPHDTARLALSIMDNTYARAYTAYADLLALGVAKEVARNVLPLAQMTEFIWSVNLRSLFNFLSLRLAATALLEIRRAATDVHELAIPVCPEAFNAWELNQCPTP